MTDETFLKHAQEENSQPINVGMEPCPFCSATWAKVFGPTTTPVSAAWMVHCQGCGVETAGWETREQAIQHWNSRASVAAPPGDADTLAQWLRYARVELQWHAEWWDELSEPHCKARARQARALIGDIEIVLTTIPPVTAPVGTGEQEPDPTVDKFLATIANGLRHAIRDHGPITKEWIGSAAKRVWGRIKGTKYDPFRTRSDSPARITGIEPDFDDPPAPHKVVFHLSDGSAVKYVREDSVTASTTPVDGEQVTREHECPLCGAAYSRRAWPRSACAMGYCPALNQIAATTPPAATEAGEQEIGE